LHRGPFIPIRVGAQRDLPQGITRHRQCYVVRVGKDFYRASFATYGEAVMARRAAVRAYRTHHGLKL
jgi:hypothetical protein